MAQNIVTTKIVTVLKSLWNNLNWWKITNYSLMLMKKWFFFMYSSISFFLPVIRFFCLVAVYLIGGVLFQIFVRKNSGKNAIPNATFWLDFPALVKVCWFIIVNNVLIHSTYIPLYIIAPFQSFRSVNHVSGSGCSHCYPFTIKACIKQSPFDHF